ncbi:MAG: hypothetical protein ABI026_04950 [Gemmatimonadaceae bacterium]
MTLYLFVHNTSWTVERRRVLVRNSVADRLPDEKLFLFFTAADGEVRRSDIAENFPEEPTARLLESVWRFAEVIRAGDPGEMTTRGEIVVPGMRDVAVAVFRAFALRCPNCGARGVTSSWFKLKRHCGQCRIRLERGESSEYFLGGMLFNIFLAELIFAAVLLIVTFTMWPKVPWRGMEFALVGAMIVAPIVLYPASRLLWLALDLLLRPPDATEMAWHKSESDE